MSTHEKITQPTNRETGAPPASAWVRFLRSYGPTPQNLTLFDEHVVKAVKRARVEPITLATPLLNDMISHIERRVPGSMLIVGTAGDGKTYHCRALWTHLGGQVKDWADKGNVKELRLADGRLAVFIKDLSEFNGQESDQPLHRFERSVLGGDDSEVVILAANHGQVLDRLRDLGKRQERQHPLRESLQKCFLQAGPAPDRLAVFDLSRTTTRQTFEEVAKIVAGHQEWDHCSRCSLKAGEKVCPIDVNRRRLLGADDGAHLAGRLGDLIEIARLNGLHLPVRDLLALCSNMILGYSDAKIARENLMTCADVAKIQDMGNIGRASIYANAFGANLPKRRMADRPVFKAMAGFGVGEETTNGTDGLLVYGKDDSRLQADFARLVANDPIYGATPSYQAAQSSYLEGHEGARLADGADEFMGMLKDQRRRLYFTLPSDESNYSRWAMTIFRYAGEYLEIIHTLTEGKKQVNDTVRSRIAKGLNRVLTGMLLENTDKIFIASSGGFTQSRMSMLCDFETSARRQQGVGMSIRLNGRTGRPRLEVQLSTVEATRVDFDLTPIRYEFLSRVAEGSLPASFSNECLEDLLAFKAKLLRKAETVRKNNMADDDEVGGDEEVMTIDFIDIEPAGRGLTRPVTVRAPE